jgi:hypothetical protein
MSLSTQFNGGARIVSQVFGGNAVVQANTLYGVQNARTGAPASWVSGSFQTLLSATGRGTLNFAAIRATDATSRTLRLRISIDGRTSPYLSDLTLTTSGTGHAIVGLGALKFSSDGTFSYLIADLQPIPYSSSLLVEASNTLTEAGGAAQFLYNYEVNV